MQPVLQSILDRKDALLKCFQWRRNGPKFTALSLTEAHQTLGISLQPLATYFGHHSPIMLLSNEHSNKLRTPTSSHITLAHGRQASGDILWGVFSCRDSETLPVSVSDQQRVDANADSIAS